MANFTLTPITAAELKSNRTRLDPSFGQAIDQFVAAKVEITENGKKVTVPMPFARFNMEGVDLTDKKTRLQTITRLRNVIAQKGAPVKVSQSGDTVNLVRE